MIPTQAASRPRTSAFRYAVVEDEPLARKMLLAMIRPLAPDAELAWEAVDGDQALERLLNDPVDVLFLDVVFPPDGAFGFLEAAKAALPHLPEIVFVTGHENQATRAFEWAACDYLVKPLNPDRVKASLDRVRLRHTAADREALLNAMKGLIHTTGPERFTVAIKDRILVFRWSEVYYLHTEFRQVFAHTSGGKVPLDQAMDELERLLGEGFVRIHRSTLVNLDYLSEVRAPSGCAGEAVLRDGSTLSVSRRRLDALLARLSRWR